MSHMRQVTFSAWWKLRYNTTQLHKHKNVGSREERDAYLLAGNTCIILSFELAKDENIKVRTLCAGDKLLSSFKNTTSYLKKHLESQHSTIKFTEEGSRGICDRAVIMLVCVQDALKWLNWFREITYSCFRKTAWWWWWLPEWLPGNSVYRDVRNIVCNWGYYSDWHEALVIVI